MPSADAPASRARAARARAARAGARALSRAWGLPRPTHHDVEVDHDLRVPMDDGIELLADRWRPAGDDRAPLLLVRSPYGRRSAVGLVYGRLFAHQGFSVLLQSCRGRYGSGGSFDAPAFGEAADGQATVRWLRDQPWFDGAFATMGPSYLGFVQWALAEDPPPELRAMVVQVGLHDYGAAVWGGGSLALENTLGWAQQVTEGDHGLLRSVLGMPLRERRLAATVGKAPLLECYREATGARVDFFERWLEHPDPDDPWWDPIDHGEALERVTVPVLLQTGWYDIFLGQTLHQYHRLRERRVPVGLTVGPWTHLDVSAGGWPTVMAEAVEWLRAAFDGDGDGDGARRPAAPVRVSELGTGLWRELADWPPPARTERWHLHPGGVLDRSPPPSAQPDGYRYDPADPTPSVGGPLLARTAGPRDNRELEARDDVLVYTSAPLERDLEVYGPVSVELWVESSAPSADFFARLCDVDPSGRSTNVCDGFARLGEEALRPAGRGAEDAVALTLQLEATACRLARGHRVRLQVSSGAHPRFARNPGTGEPTATATRLRSADQRVHRDPDRPSALVLAVLEPGG